MTLHFTLASQRQDVLHYQYGCGVGKAIGKRNALIRYVAFFPVLFVTTAATSAPYLVPVNATIPFRKI